MGEHLDPQIREKLEVVFGEKFSEDDVVAYYRPMQLYQQKRISWGELVPMIQAIRWVSRGKTPESLEPLEDVLAPRKAFGKAAAVSRVRLLSKILAMQAGSDPAVIQFRTEMLKGKLLPWNAIQKWILKEAEKEHGAPFLLLDGVPLPPACAIRHGLHGGRVPDPPVTIDDTHPAAKLRVVTLEYGTPDRKGVQAVPIAHRGVLARLQKLTVTLEQRYRWQQAQATIFVLTGITPIIQTIDDTVQYAQFTTNAGPVTALSRIVLTVDPMTPPKELLERFQQLRQRLVGKSQRDLRDRQLALVAFSLERPAGESARERMHAWNAQHKNREKWPYSRVEHFTRDAARACKKLLNPLTWNDSQEK